ncbi:MAG: DUF6252 family protein [Sphingobacteriales bacterium]
MKTLYTILLFFFSITLLSSSCKKHVIQPVTQLPPATQTGANTFGCLINGQAFLPHNNGNIFNFDPPALQASYVYTGGYYFSILADNHNSDGSITNITVETDSLSISQGQSFKLTASYAHGTTGAGGSAGAAYNIFGPSGIYNYYTSANLASGLLTITYLDSQKRIVSGTFYFNVLNNTNDTVKITNGRFDMHYTR